MQDVFDLPEPWFCPADERAYVLRREALVEIGPGHELAGRGLTTVAVRSDRDDVIFRLDDGTFAIVHLTWTGRPESGPWPATRRMESLLDLWRAAGDHDH